MAENINKELQKIIKYSPPLLLRCAKRLYRYPRFFIALNRGRKNYKKYGGLYKYNIIFVAGLPKSGTTWLENMLVDYPGYTIIPDPEVTLFDYKYGGTEYYQIDPKYFHRLNEALALVKIHAHGSFHNINLLHEHKIPYCIMYRDLRDAAVSYVHYVKRTPWHPQYSIYKDLSIQEGLYFFGHKYLEIWRDWVEGWLRNRDPLRSLVLKYENLLNNSEAEFRRVVEFYNLPLDRVKGIVSDNEFSNMQSRGSFFRKGASGDWRTYFDKSSSEIYKSKIGDFLIEHGYETDYGW